MHATSPANQQCLAPQKAMNLSEAQHASLRDARRQLLMQTQTLRRQRAHLLQQLNTPLPGDSDVLNTEALSQVSCLPRPTDQCSWAFHRAKAVDNASCAHTDVSGIY